MGLAVCGGAKHQLAPCHHKVGRGWPLSRRCCQNQSADSAEASRSVWSCVPAQCCRCVLLLRSCAGSLNERLHKCHRGLIFFGVSYCLTDLIKATFSCQQPWFPFRSALPAIPHRLFWPFGRSLRMLSSCFSLVGGCWAPPWWHRRDMGSNA